MKTLLTLGFALVLTGCGSLNVEVSVLDPKRVEAEVDRQLLREALPTILGQIDREAEQPIIDLQREHFDLLEQLRESYEAASKKTGESHELELESIQEDLKAFRPKYVAAKQLMKDVHANVTALHQQLEWARDESERMRIEAKIAHQLKIREERLSSLVKTVEDNVSRQITSAPPEVRRRPEAAIGLRKTIGEVRSLIRGQGLVEDRFAHAVASAEDDLWAPRFNRVLGGGNFGNLNMAVKMEDLGDFTLKGLTFDPSDVARVAGKVTTQALLLATQIAGVPVSTAVPQAGTGTTPVAGASLAASSKQLAEAQRARAFEQAQLESHREALLAVAGIVLREWSSLEDDARREAGIAAIKSGFAANKPRLTLTSSGAAEAADEEEDTGEETGEEEEETGENEGETEPADDGDGDEDETGTEEEEDEDQDEDDQPPASPSPTAAARKEKGDVL